METEKESTSKIFCVFHESQECHCAHQVVDQETLIQRSKFEIELKNRLNALESDAEKKDIRQQEIILLENRLNDLKE